MNSLIISLSLLIGFVAIYLFLPTNFGKPVCPFPEFAGPRGLPVLGNIHQLGGKQWITYTGRLKPLSVEPLTSCLQTSRVAQNVRLNLAGQSVLVIGSAKIAADLLRFVMASGILTGGMNLVFAPYGDRITVGGECVKLQVMDYQFKLSAEANTLLHNLINAEKSLDDQLRRTAASTVLGVVYAYPPVSFEDPLVQRVEDYVDRLLKAALPGNYLVDIIPVMKHLPLWLAPWKRHGYSWFKQDTEMWLNLVDNVRSGLKFGERSDSLVAKLIDPTQPQNLDQVETAWLAGMMFGAGAEAIAATLSFFILAMVLYPDVQNKLREEIDNAVGKAQLPAFNEIKSLPYLR
ncbi:cytochrome P450 [Mycena galericulata]|nr:cytochrome P450 [Mycena galericulata]